ncbi:LytR/AlgR family response regulator transcription factor [Saccharicrinis aurantiacus]|uniref:LytR/AlgR family response regulator transcription factor n=1 Tax=Saccharicrinis aurantiacus TaxID=1849719 RepID=UPI00094FD1FC|nr:LytTR family transcriptional regulator DNA-binding domain-containing protein [Saccharicrinis aurantiacus]
MIDCIIIEDEPLAIEKLRIFIQKIPELNLINTFSSGINAIGFINSNSIDLIFLDIEMKELSGIQLLESTSINSKVIITTAYENYALKGYELQVCDYLLKPITFNRFIKAFNKVQHELEKQKTTKVGSKIFIKTEYRLEGINTSCILYIEGMGDYRKIVTENKSIMTLQNFKELAKILPSDNFCRVHNSFLVSINKIEKIERNRITIKNNIIPVSDSYGKYFYKKIKSK